MNLRINQLLPAVGTLEIPFDIEASLAYSENFNDNLKQFVINEINRIRTSIFQNDLSITESNKNLIIRSLDRLFFITNEQKEIKSTYFDYLNHLIHSDFENQINFKQTVLNVDFSD